MSVPRTEAAAPYRLGPDRGLSFVVLLNVAVLVGSLHAEIAQGVAEPALKAAFLLNFARFTEWPAGMRAMNAPLVLCSSDDAVTPALESTVAGQTIERHPVAASQMSLDGPLHTCALVYMGKVDRTKAAEVADRLHGTGVLTVGDEQAFAAAGGMIGLFVEQGRMRFAINVSAAERGRVRLSSKLLSLAHIMKD